MVNHSQFSGRSFIGKSQKMQNLLLTLFRGTNYTFTIQRLVADRAWNTITDFLITFISFNQSNNILEHLIHSGYFKINKISCFTQGTNRLIWESNL